MTRRYRVPSQSRLRSRNYSRCRKVILEKVALNHGHGKIEKAEEEEDEPLQQGADIMQIDNAHIQDTFLQTFVMHVVLQKILWEEDSQKQNEVDPFQVIKGRLLNLIDPAVQASFRIARL
ncbi:hypothetical protein T03_4841 [Trichinella britovi]|uniref:Uncharacterized protein n=1 Tax=Trichinella britovi TaxID=45882 RepID=A0A0V1CB75_TRIBR|nr:hypothetical protein T03_4841 [Trichinella britovi]